jgi:hypothetical protein
LERTNRPGLTTIRKIPIFNLYFMRKICYLLCIFILTDCSKKSGVSPTANSIINSTSYDGFYIGPITYIENGVSVNNGTQFYITITNSDPKNMGIKNSLTNAQTAILSVNIFTISKHSYFQNPDDESAYIVEYGSGTFNGNKLTIDFHQDVYLYSNNQLFDSAEFTGTLIKQ